MSTTVILNDFMNNRRAHLVYSARDFDIMTEFWQSTDRVLDDLQGHRLFTGKTRWCDLDPMHFRLLLMQNMLAADTLDETEMSDDENPIVRSLNFLFMAMCFCLSKRVGGEVEVMRVNRLNDTDITYDISVALLQLDIETEDETNEPEEIVPAVAPGFRVIVDNTGSRK